ncbi:MAG: enoyl-ACP reductase FabI [Alphaproteobacteria bacterium]|nr:enoyl-ACP reductase FabI [Alphaproteobacteria bacterium]
MTQSAALMTGKRGLIMGVASDRSIAYGIAKAVHDQGAELCLTYQSEPLLKRVAPLAQQLGTDFLIECDVMNGETMDRAFAAIGDKWGKLDFAVHAIAFSDKDQLTGQYLNTSRDNFLKTLDVSCFSFTDMCRRAVPLMNDGGSLVTLTYYGAERVMPHYNVMGVAKAALEASVRYLAVDLGPQNIRVNAISAGPIRTLAAMGIGDFRHILKWNQLNAPLKRNVTTDDVGQAGLYLLSDLSAAVTGEVHHVDCGYNIVGMLATDAASDLSDLLKDFKAKD